MTAQFVPEAAFAAQVEAAVMARNGRARESSITFSCPAHDDEHPSASYDRSKHVWRCHSCNAGGGIRDLAKRLGPETPAPAPPRRVVETYAYADETGALLFEVVRYEPKAFTQRRPDGKGGWVYKGALSGVRRVLFRLPDVLAAARQGRRVYVTEGEKDANAIAGLGLCATTPPMGAGKWRADYAAFLSGAEVVVIADKDAPGGEHAAQVAASCTTTARSVKVIEMPGDHVKDVADWIAAGGNAVTLEQLADAAPVGTTMELTVETQAAPPENGPSVLAEIAAFIRRFVVLTPEAAVTTALWVAHTHAFDAADATPYLNVKSAEKRSGKTRLLEVVELLVARPWLTGRTTAAALYRKVDAERPTLLLDESDAAFGGDKEYAEVLRGVLNSGHRRGGRVTVCVGQGTNTTTRDFTTFCPKMIAGIGRLPDTVTDRSIPIALRRRAKAEAVERFRHRTVAPEAKRLQDRVQRWATQNRDALRGVEPALPDELDDRAQDAWEPLLAIADRAGGDWPDRARRAARVLSGGEARDDDSNAVRLLLDCRVAFDDGAADRLATADLIVALVKDEEGPWREWNKGKEITPRGLARLLTPFGITSRNVRLPEVKKGYLRESFEDAWTRYLPAATTATIAQPDPKSATPLQPDAGRTETQIALRYTDPSEADAQPDENAIGADLVAVVADATDQQAPAAAYDYQRPETWPPDYRRWYEQTVAFQIDDGTPRAEAEDRARRDIALYLAETVTDAVTPVSFELANGATRR